MFCFDRLPIPFIILFAYIAFFVFQLAAGVSAVLAVNSVTLGSVAGLVIGDGFVTEVAEKESKKEKSACGSGDAASQNSESQSESMAGKKEYAMIDNRVVFYCASNAAKTKDAAAEADKKPDEKGEFSLASSLPWFVLALMFQYFARRYWWMLRVSWQVEKTGSSSDLYKLDDRYTLLPSQKKLVDTIVSDICRSSNAGRMIAIRGGWGSGKSTVLRGLIRQFLSLKSEPSERNFTMNPIYISAWQEEAEDDIEFRLIANIVKDPVVFWAVAPCLTNKLLHQLATVGYATKTRAFFLASFIDGLIVKMKPHESTEVSVTFKNQSPLKLDYQEDLRRVLKALRVRETRLVVIVDEIERGAAKCVQQTLALLRRSFEIPGITVVLPYVKDVVDEMAFQPVRVGVADMVNVTYATLAASPKLREIVSVFPEKNKDKEADGAQVKSDRDDVAGSVQESSGVVSDKIQSGKSSDLEVNTWDADDFWKRLLKGFYSEEFEQSERLQLINRMRNKYLSAEHNIPTNQWSDLYFLVVEHPLFADLEKSELIAAIVCGERGGDYYADTVTLLKKLAVLQGEDRRAEVQRIADYQSFVAGTLDDAVFKMSPGALSLRTFMGHVNKILGSYLAKSGEAPRFLLGLDLKGLVEQQEQQEQQARQTYSGMTFPEKILSAFLFFLVAVALTMTRAEEGDNDE